MNENIVNEGYTDWYPTNDGQFWRYRPDGTVEYMD